MKYVLDTHTHTLVSGHAYNTMTEMMQAAAEKGLELLCITDHTPAMPGSTHPYYFGNSTIIDRQYYQQKFGGKTRFFIGCELNILDGGEIDLSENDLRKLDIKIASMHIPCIRPGTEAENTKTYLKVMRNPHVNIIGHPDDGRYPVDMRALVEGAKENRKILELNNHSLDPDCTRSNARENDLRMLELCKEYRQPVVVGSDAHIETNIGAHDRAYQLLESIGFPEELVLNTSVERLLAYL